MKGKPDDKGGKREMIRKIKMTNSQKCKKKKKKGDKGNNSIFKVRNKKCKQINHQGITKKGGGAGSLCGRGRGWVAWAQVKGQRERGSLDRHKGILPKSFLRINFMTTSVSFDTTLDSFILFESLLCNSEKI